MLNSGPQGSLVIHDVLAELSKIQPSKPFIHYHDKTYTYSETLMFCSGLASSLSAMGIRKGDRACILLPRVPETVIALLGMSMLGVLPIPVNYTLSKDEVNNFIAAQNPALTLIHARAFGVLDERVLGLKNMRLIAVGDETPGAIPWGRVATPSATGPKVAVRNEDIAYLNYTTGSSGSPKGARCTHENIYWNTAASCEAMDITKDDVHLCMFASFAHPHELYARALYTGGTLALLEEINPKTIARTIVDKGVTCMMGLAPMYEMMKSQASQISLGGLRVAESGGMYTRPDISNGFMEKFGIPVLSVWGSTETSGIALANRPGRYRTDGSMGMACPYYEIKLIDDDGNELGVGEIGEILIKSNAVISGYYDYPTFNSIDGWYCTGDLGIRDDEGFYYFTERKNGMLKVAGLKVYPLQVELLLIGHPDIKEVAVMGYEDKLRGVVPRAFVVAKEGASLDPDGIRHFLKGKIADYMIPKKVDILAELPKIGSGKVNKKELQRLYI